MRCTSSLRALSELAILWLVVEYRNVHTKCARLNEDSSKSAITMLLIKRNANSSTKLWMIPKVLRWKEVSFMKWYSCSILTSTCTFHLRHTTTTSTGSISQSQSSVAKNSTRLIELGSYSISSTWMIISLCVSKYRLWKNIENLFSKKIKIKRG